LQSSLGDKLANVWGLLRAPLVLGSRQTEDMYPNSIQRLPCILGSSSEGRGVFQTCLQASRSVRSPKEDSPNRAVLPASVFVRDPHRKGTLPYHSSEEFFES